MSPYFLFSPAPFPEPHPFMIVFSEFPPLYRTLSYAQPPGHIAPPTGVLLSAPSAPEFRSACSFSPFLYFSLSCPLSLLLVQKEEHKRTHATIMLAKYLKMFNSGMNFEDLCNILSSLTKKKEKERKKIPKDCISKKMMRFKGISLFLNKFNSLEDRVGKRLASSFCKWENGKCLRSSHLETLRELPFLRQTLTCGGKGRPFKNIMTEGKKLKLALNIFANNNIQGRNPYLNNHKLNVFHTNISCHEVEESLLVVVTLSRKDLVGRGSVIITPHHHCPAPSGLREEGGPSRPLSEQSLVQLWLCAPSSQPAGAPRPPAPPLQPSEPRPLSLFALLPDPGIRALSSGAEVPEASRGSRPGNCAAGTARLPRPGWAPDVDGPACAVRCGGRKRAGGLAWPGL
eukprot:bmy_13948T0